LSKPRDGGRNPKLTSDTKNLLLPGALLMTMRPQLLASFVFIDLGFASFF
jgi:hypothetical protein